MVQLRLSGFKTGMKPNPRSGFNLNNLTPIQKMQLTYCRIWGTSIGDNIKSGYKVMKKKPNKFNPYIYWGSIPRDHMPWMDDYTDYNMKKVAILERRERVLMRGVKIGQRKGIDASGKFSIFNTKKSTTV